MSPWWGFYLLPKTSFQLYIWELWKSKQHGSMDLLNPLWDVVKPNFHILLVGLKWYLSSSENSNSEILIYNALNVWVISLSSSSENSSSEILIYNALNVWVIFPFPYSHSGVWIQIPLDVLKILQPQSCLKPTPSVGRSVCVLTSPHGKGSEKNHSIY